ncbi:MULTISPECIES: ABC transporter substrate-binding protein [unclassified Nocardiopsis]|uniref:ABC transporter substrate-binding protein n=1 Tax=unclassified Nocardiopsis TaxID=2649073 RepID=UPI001358B0EE|nr:MULTISPECIES: ABC transporter substrate-binding protein [unclassified Nocardiopsis]
MRTARRIPLALLGAALALTACGAPDSGSPDTDEPAAGEGAFPVTVTDATGEVTIEQAPERIVSLSASHTEMLFAIGAGDQVEAVDEYSTYPEEAPTTELSGFEPNVEAISEYDPDLVLLARSAEETADQLESLGIPALVLDAAADLEDTYAQIRLLGEATGHAEEADAEAERVESDFDAVVEDVREQVGEVDLTFYQELDDTSYSATSATFVGQVYAAFGLENIADAADEDGSGYPQLSREYIVEEDPDLIFLSYGDESAVADVAARPAFDTVTAVRNDAVYLLDADIASRWGPRVVEFAELVGQAVVENAGE